MIYNVALVFEKGVGEEIYGFYEKFKGEMDFEFGLKKDSVAHASVVKFESEEEVDGLLDGLGGEWEVDFSGISFLPSHSGEGCWVEISILKSGRLAEIQEKLVERLAGCEIKSGVGDRFRPHVTFGKMRDCSVRVSDLDYFVLRKKGVRARLVVGAADEDFEFYEL